MKARPRPGLKSCTVGCVVVVGLFAMGFGVWSHFMQWIPAGHVGVLFHAQGGLERKVYTPRRVFVGWMTTLYVYPTMQQSAIYTNDPEEGEVKAADAVRVTTSDNANTDFDVVVWYHIEPSNVLTIFDNYRTQPLEQIQATNIRAAVRQAASVIGTQYDAFALMGEARSEASAKLTVELKRILETKGITIDRADFAGAYPQEAVIQRITNSVNAETQLRIAQLQQEIAQHNKTIAITKARAETTAAMLTAGQTKGKSLEMLSIETDIDGLKKWNGKLPPIQSRPGQSVIITPDVVRMLGNSSENGR